MSDLDVLKGLDVGLEKLLTEKSKNKILDYRPYPKQKDFHELGSTKTERLLSAGNQLGKVLRNGTKVATPAGWVPIESLNVGDKVISGDGEPTTVTGVFHHTDWPFLRLKFSSFMRSAAREIDCGPEHLWVWQHPQARFATVQDRHGKRANPRYGEWLVSSTEDIIKAVGSKPLRAKRRAAVPSCAGWELEYKPVSVEPYLLGALLGDGCLRQGAIQLSSIDADVVFYAQAALDKMHGECSLVPAGGADWRVNGATQRLKPALEKLGVYGKLSYEKFVPDEYLYNRADVRLSVLQGLMDTDGGVHAGAVEFSTTSHKLAKDVETLVISLGGKVGITDRFTKYTHKGVKKTGRKSYRVKICAPHLPLFRLGRKAGGLAKLKKRYTDNWILHSAVPVEKGDGCCISVQHESATYVIEGGIVTHNTFSGAHELAYHVTGMYPAWWKGRTWDRPIKAWVGGESGEVIRDTSQKLLFGDIAADERNLGTGIIPAEAIVNIEWSRGVANAIDVAAVKWRDNPKKISTIKFKSYEMKRKKWQGDTIDLIWLDEEPPLEIYTEAYARRTKTRGMVYLTFTPLQGMSDVVKRFKLDPNDLRAEVVMTYRDAEHIDDDALQEMLSGYPEHERECRINGVPMQGEGRIYTVPESSITVEPQEIPEYWPRILGADFGHGDHPTAGAWLAWDRDRDIVYLYHSFRQKGGSIANNAERFRQQGRIPISWPQDLNQRDRVSANVTLREHYVRNYCYMLPSPARNPDGSNSVWAGVVEIQQRMLDGRFKVFSDQIEFFEEFRNYHMKDGKIVKVDDDLLDAVRYGIMGLKYARVVDEDWHPGKQKSMFHNAKKNTKPFNPLEF